MSEKVALMLLAIEADVVNESSRFLSELSQFVVLGLSVPQEQVRSGFILCLLRSDLGSIHAVSS